MPRKSIPANHNCHVHDRAHDKVNEPGLRLIRERICAFGAPLKAIGGKHYCQFHLQTNEKAIGLFDKLFHSMVAATMGKIKEEVKSLDATVASAELAENIDAAMQDRYRGQSDDSFDERLERIDQERTIFDFRYVWFPSEFHFPEQISAMADFRFATFGGEAHFGSTRFFNEVDFESVTFCSRANFRDCFFAETVNFSKVTFNADADFYGSIFFTEASFRSATFTSKSDYSSVTFCSKSEFSAVRVLEGGQLFFKNSCLKGIVDLSLAIIQGYLHFEAGEGMFFDGEWMNTQQTVPKKTRRYTAVFEHGLDITDIRAENPERISFNKVRLCPSWFVNSDPRKFIFTDVDWQNHMSGKLEIDSELDALKNRNYDYSHSLRLLTVAFHNLAANAEEFNRFDDASNFRRAAFECEKKAKSQKVPFNITITYLRKGDFALLHRIYRWLSYYGESWSWAALVLIGALFFFGLFYNSPFASFEQSQNTPAIAAISSIDRTYKMNNSEGIVYSFYVAALQRPDPKPADTLTRFFVIFETIFAPLQAALLALAIRRKFMR